MENQYEVAFYHDRCCMCMNKFERGRAHRKRLTCSPKCRLRLFHLRHPEKPALRRLARQQRARIDSTVCRVCGKRIDQPATGRRRATCSDACRKQDSRRKHGRCAHCGKAFRRKKSSPGQRFCSIECRTKQKIKDKWPQELARRLKSAGPPLRKRRGEDDKPYRVEKLPLDGEKPAQAPDWWVELKFEDWLNARKRKNQRFSKPERWEEKAVSIPLSGVQQSAVSNGKDNGEGNGKGGGEQQRPIRPPLWGGGEVIAEEEAAFPKPKPLTGEEWAKLRQEQIDKLARAGIKVDSESTWAELEDGWAEYERRAKPAR